MMLVQQIVAFKTQIDILNELNGLVALAHWQDKNYLTRTEKDCKIFIITFKT